MDDYEKLYKEALERAKNLHKDAIDMGENLRAKQCEIIFPELAESEDERIRKEIIDIIKSQKEQQCHIDGAIYDKMIAWLEKQSNQKEQLINRACEWLKKGGYFVNNTETMEDFRKAMEE